MSSSPVGELNAFMRAGRRLPERRPVEERLGDWLEVYTEWPEPEARRQASRCMDCGVPFCSSGCPLRNLIPDWNDLVYNGDWRGALAQLHATNNFPEFTGRVCPAPCEPACTLAINRDAVTIEMIEKTIAERGWSEGWIEPAPPSHRSGKSVAVIGSGPAGLACAQQLNRAGHSVTVFERDECVGGLLSLGIPDFKLEKHVVRRRVEQLEAEGVVFRVNTSVGDDFPTERLRAEFDAVCLTAGATVARDLPIPGRDLGGVHLAMEYLVQQNRRNAGREFAPGEAITAEGKTVVILGGGDTGADCLGTALRQGATRVLQFELLAAPPEDRAADNPWPQWPAVFRRTPAHEEGGEQDFGIMTQRFEGSGGRLERLSAVRIDWRASPDGGRPQMVEVPGSEFTVEADLVLLALGFLHGNSGGLLGQLGVQLDERGNVDTDERMMTSVDGVFAGGDMQRGQSLVVYAIAGGRAAARGCDEWLMGASSLPPVYRYARPAV